MAAGVFSPVLAAGVSTGADAIATSSCFMVFIAGFAIVLTSPLKIVGLGVLSAWTAAATARADRQAPAAARPPRELTCERFSDLNEFEPDMVDPFLDGKLLVWFE